MGQKTEYEQKYIKTFVNIKNSILKDSGIMCVGIDTHFAGPMLVDAPTFMPLLSEVLSGWKNLSATSYGAKLTFSEDVRIYDWKNVESIDSSTIIENNVIEEGFTELLSFDIKQMISKLSDTSLIYTSEKGEQYVHGGIVFFGGGKNYSVFEHNGESFKGLFEENTIIQFNNYKISLKDIEKDFLEAAAGDKPFYFTLYGKDSAFTPQAQTQILNSNDAYNCIYFNY